MRKYRVKLVDTGEYSTSDVAYKAQDGRYYSDKKAYDQIRAEKEYRFQCINYLSSLLGYDNNIPAPTFLYKKIEEMKKCGYKVIYKTIEQQEGNIIWSLEHKEFKNEINKISYIIAIIRNNIIDVYKEEKAAVIKERQQKVANIISIDDYKVQKQKTKDISRWLDDGEDYTE